MCAPRLHFQSGTRLDERHPGKVLRALPDCAGGEWRGRSRLCACVVAIKGGRGGLVRPLFQRRRAREGEWRGEENQDGERAKQPASQRARSRAVRGVGEPAEARAAAALRCAERRQKEAAPACGATARGWGVGRRAALLGAGLLHSEEAEPSEAGDGAARGLGQPGEGSAESPTDLPGRARERERPRPHADRIGLPGKEKGSRGGGGRGRYYYYY